MKVIVTEYNKLWPSMFKKESERIKSILKDECIEIYHIGSTAVENLKAKPIIDIMPVVKNILKIDELNSEFEKIGYECMGEFGIKGRRYFRKGTEVRTHQIHIFEVLNKKDIIRHLAVRDYLKSHPDIAFEYGEFKENLSKRFPEDIEGYCDGKDEFVKALEQKALKWYKVSDMI